MRSVRVKGKAFSPSLALGFFFLLSFSAPAPPARQRNDLPAAHKKWLEEEVVYIITPVEKEVFLKLSTDRERDMFIEAFWKHRDPIPGTPENEFKNEHFRRLSYANQFFGRDTPRSGWRTDRGRVYIILGEPNEVQRSEGKTETYPTEVWFYQGKTDIGLPPGFYVVFFRPGNVGEYRLYSPSLDGPQALMTSYLGDPVDYVAAYKALKEHDELLAEVSMSLIPGETSTVLRRPSLSSDLLIQRVETTPQRTVEEKYARKFLEYKDIVEVEYSANYIDSDGLVKLIKDPTGLYFVHFCVEPETLSVGESDRKYYTTLKMNGSVTTPEGKLIHQFDRSMTMNFDRDQLAGISRQPLSIHEMFPLIAGEYRFSVLVKNEVSKEFTSFATNLTVPGEEPALQMTSPILAYKVVPVEPGQDGLKPFRFSRCQVYAQPNRAFLKKDTLGVVFQVHGLGPEVRERAELRFVFLRDDSEFRVLTRKPAQYPGLPDVLEEVPLADFPPAHYNLRVSLTVDGREVVSSKDEFDITHLTAISRPWAYSKIMPSSTDPVYDYVVGTQLFNAGRVEEAVARLERAHRLRPGSAEFALNLAQAYVTKDDYAGIETLLLPFLGGEKPAPYEFYFLLGRARQKAGEWDKAIALFDEASTHYGTNTNILNALAECYFQKGNAPQALAVWEKSLELNPEQPEVRRAVETLKGKKEGEEEEGAFGPGFCSTPI